MCGVCALLVDFSCPTEWPRRSMLPFSSCSAAGGALARLVCIERYTTPVCNISDRVGAALWTTWVAGCKRQPAAQQAVTSRLARLTWEWLLMPAVHHYSA